MNEITADQVMRLKVAREESTWHRYVSELIPIVILYLALAFYRIDGQSLWTDEAWSISERLLVGQTLWTELNRLSPLYFILLGLWSTLLGTTEFSLRALSAVLGVGAVCLTYVIGDKLFNRRTAVFAAILLATSPYFIWYAQEVRYITLTLLTSLIMTYSFHRAISAGSWKWWLWYSATSLLAFFSFMTGIFLVGAHGLYLLCFSCHRPTLRKWIAYQVLTFLAVALWLFYQSGPNLNEVLTKTPTVSWESPTRSSNTVPAPDLAGIIPYTFYAFSVGFSLGPSLRELHVSRSATTLLRHAPILTMVGLLFAFCFIAGLRQLRQNPDACIFLLLWLIVPIVGTFLIATTTTFGRFNTRYVAVSLPAYLLILAAGISGLRRSRIQLALLGYVLLVNGTALANYQFDAEYSREDARSAALFLESAVRPGDEILVVGNPVALRYYYKADVPLIFVDSQTLQSQASKSGARLWLVEIRPWETDPKGKIKATLEKRARREVYKEFPGVQIYSYRLT